MENIRKRYFGDKDFYEKIFGIALPIMIQNGFTNFINLIDNLMVGQIGTDQMSGVAIVNQLLFIFNLSIFSNNGGKLFTFIELGFTGILYLFISCIIGSINKRDLSFFKGIFKVKRAKK